MAFLTHAQLAHLIDLMWQAAPPPGVLQEGQTLAVGPLHAEAQLIPALWDALPTLLAELQAGRQVVATAKRLIDTLNEFGYVTDASYQEDLEQALATYAAQER